MLAEKLIALRRLKEQVARIEGWCFDAARGIETRQGVSVKDLTLSGAVEGAFDYLPARAHTVRLLLDRLPLQKYSEYTFLDIGSGKGKILFLAAEYPFRRVLGIEFALELHQQAQQNI